MDRAQTDLQHLQKKIVREKQIFSNLMDKFEKLQNSQSTDKSSQLNTSQHEELQISRSLDEDTMTELAKIQLKMEDVSVSLEKVKVIKDYWMKQVYTVCI